MVGGVSCGCWMVGGGRQVGDCWFLAALAVVAERHDLIARLFAGFGDSGCIPANDAGCYLLRLFLDGQWRTIRIDDRVSAVVRFF